METSWHSYPKILALGHAALTELLYDEVIVEEKIDGSQYSFGMFEDGFKARSKGAMLNRMFELAIENTKDLDLHFGWTYRGEYLKKPKHNALAYDRVPRKNIIIFDINSGYEKYLSYKDKAREAERLGLEIVPNLYEGKINDINLFRELLKRVSYLGGQQIEGVVIKNYKRFGADGKALMGKFVSEKYKEVHSQVWKETNLGSKDIISKLIEKYRTPARWEKAVQHLKEDGKLEDSSRDIGLIIKEIWPDIESECKDEISNFLYNWAKDKIRRGVCAGVPEWYKEKLLSKRFKEDS